MEKQRTLENLNFMNRRENLVVQEVSGGVAAQRWWLSLPPVHSTTWLLQKHTWFEACHEMRGNLQYLKSKCP